MSAVTRDRPAASADRRWMVVVAIAQLMVVLDATIVSGTRPFVTRRYDRATSLWPLTLVSFGESRRNMHHSDPACAWHGVDPGQVDISAAVIRIFERLGWATKVRWPTPAHLERRHRDAIR